MRKALVIPQARSWGEEHTMSKGWNWSLWSRMHFWSFGGADPLIQSLSWEGSLEQSTR